MHVVLLISRAPTWALRLASQWAAAGDTVTAVLCDHGAALARPGHDDAEAVSEAIQHGVMVRAHDDALRRRALPQARLLPGVKAIDLDEVADLVAASADQAMWL